MRYRIVKEPTTSKELVKMLPLGFVAKQGKHEPYGMSNGSEYYDISHVSISWYDYRLPMYASENNVLKAWYSIKSLLM
jgi:hypothetical protein